MAKIYLPIDYVAGALPKSGTFTPTGGHCFVQCFGSGFSTSAGIVTSMNVLLDSVSKGTVQAIISTANTHYAFVPRVIDLGVLTAASHTIQFTAGTSLSTDTNDRFQAIVTEVA